MITSQQIWKEMNKKSIGNQEEREEEDVIHRETVEKGDNHIRFDEKRK